MLSVRLHWGGSLNFLVNFDLLTYELQVVADVIYRILSQILKRQLNMEERWQLEFENAVRSLN